VSLTARRILGFAPWLKDPLWRKSQAAPSLDLRFADNKSLVDAVSGQNLITFTRASSATFIDSTGTLRTAATNEPRFDHDPITGESLGLLVEEQRTNSIRNNTMVGAVAGTPGTLPTNWICASSGVAQTIVRTGTIDGISYVDIRVNGTTTSAGGIQIKPDGNAGVISATASQAWAMSLWVSVVAGSTTNTTGQRLIVNEYSAGPTYLRTAVAATNILSGGSTLRRVSAAITTGASTTILEPILLLDVSSGVAIDITLRIGLPQLEQGAFATSVIPTTTAAATRAADVASITGTAFSSWYRQDEGTVFVDFVRTYSGNFTNYPNIYQFNDGTDNNEITLFGGQSAQFFQPSIRVSATAQLDFVSSMSKVPGPNKYAHGFAVNSSTFAGNGTTTATDTSVSLPAVNRLTFGVRSGQQFTGCYRRFTYWPRAFNSILQFLTQ
jgi:hypothetical protein